MYAEFDGEDVTDTLREFAGPKCNFYCDLDDNDIKITPYKVFGKFGKLLITDSNLIDFNFNSYDIIELSDKYKVQIVEEVVAEKSAVATVSVATTSATETVAEVVATETVAEVVAEVIATETVAEKSTEVVATETDDKKHIIEEINLADIESLYNTHDCEFTGNEPVERCKFYGTLVEIESDNESNTTPVSDEEYHKKNN